MLVSVDHGAIKKFRRTAWDCQQTFRTPLQKLAPFSATILGALGPAGSGRVIIDSVVMTPHKLAALLAEHQLPQELGRDTAVVAESAAEVLPLLSAALGDWVDFLFVPVPKAFVLYADHDEYVTFFAQSKSKLNGVVAVLAAEGFSRVEGYSRVA